MCTCIVILRDQHSQPSARRDAKPKPPTMSTLGRVRQEPGGAAHRPTQPRTPQCTHTTRIRSLTAKTPETYLYLARRGKTTAPHPRHESGSMTTKRSGLSSTTYDEPRKLPMQPRIASHPRFT